MKRTSTPAAGPSCAVHFFRRDFKAVRCFRTAVSLHSHTMHSRESLAFLPRYAKRIPLVAGLVGLQEQKYARNHGGDLDYARAYWTPPLPAHEAFNLERRQIEDRLDLGALVSITDHDSIDACLRLRAIEHEREAPLSMEWTVPLEPSFVHLGVHNLPAAAARSIAARLEDYTLNPDPTRLPELLEWLNGFENVLIVLNHPLWDEAKAGVDEHRSMVRGFAERYSGYLHAFELNGLRPWSENRSVIEFASEIGLPVVSGGDRHGTEPNANLNLSHADSFDGFVAEVRRDRQSEILFMPQYEESPRLRHLETAWDIVRTYPEFPERSRLFDRIFWEAEPGNPKPLSALLRREPNVVKYFVATMRLFNCRRVKSVLRAALAAGNEEMAL